LPTPCSTELATAPKDVAENSAADATEGTGTGSAAEYAAEVVEGTAVMLGERVVERGRAFRPSGVVRETTEKRGQSERDSVGRRSGISAEGAAQLLQWCRVRVVGELHRGRTS